MISQLLNYTTLVQQKLLYVKSEMHNAIIP